MKRVAPDEAGKRPRRAEDVELRKYLDVYEHYVDGRKVGVSKDKGQTWLGKRVKANQSTVWDDTKAPPPSFLERRSLCACPKGGRLASRRNTLATLSPRFRPYSLFVHARGTTARPHS